jgi:hypothetical protein
MPEEPVYDALSTTELDDFFMFHPAFQGGSLLGGG